MNKSELIESLSGTKNIPTEEAIAIVESFFDVLKTAMVGGERVEIRGFGSFKVKGYKGYTGRNPKSGEAVTVHPKRLPHFKPGKEFKDFLNK
jgi:integration host factor subunit beta